MGAAHRQPRQAGRISVARLSHAAACPLLLWRLSSSVSLFLGLASPPFLVFRHQTSSSIPSFHARCYSSPRIRHEPDQRTRVAATSKWRCTCRGTCIRRTCSRSAGSSSAASSRPPAPAHFLQFAAAHIPLSSLAPRDARMPLEEAGSSSKRSGAVASRMTMAGKFEPGWLGRINLGQQPLKDLPRVVPEFRVARAAPISLTWRRRRAGAGAGDRAAHEGRNSAG